MRSFVLVIFLLIPVLSSAGNTPCSGNKGGINHCEGSSFICNDGSTSRSKKDCLALFGSQGAEPNTVK